MKQSIKKLLEQGAPVPGVPPVAVEPRVWYNPELRSALFLVPGLIGFIGMITAAVSTALSVVPVALLVAPPRGPEPSGTVVTRTSWPLPLDR